MRAFVLAGLIFGLAPMPAAALIHNVAFHGYGNVTYNRIGSDPEFPQPSPPAVGTAVAITGSVLIDAASAIPDNFTGTFHFDEDALFNRQQGYHWSVAGGHARGDSGAVPYQGGQASFVAGRLTAINVYVDYDGELEGLGPSSWQTIYTRQDIDWGGTWALSVPEPSSWALMIVGFGLAGTRLRSRLVQA